MGLGSLIALSFLFSTGLAQSETFSSRCPATSVAGIPGCWGTPGSACVIDKGFDPLAGKCHYCNCGGVLAPLLPTVIAGTSALGCNYPTQPASSSYPSGTAPGPIPTSELGSPSPPSTDTTVIAGTVEGGSTVTRTFVPTTYAEFATFTIISTIVTTQTEVISTVTSNGQTSTTVVPLPIPVTSTITVGPSGVAWVPFSTSSGAPFLPPPTVLPGGIPIVISSSTNGGPPLVSSSNPIPSSTNNPVPSSTNNPVPSGTNNPVPPITSNPETTSLDDVAPPVITSFDIAILTLTSIDPSISENTAISTSDGNHPAGLYPFIHGGPKCFFCPPGVDNGGFFLWGMNKPGVYPPPVPPPVPNVPWPTITIGPGNKPTPGPKPGSEPPGDPQESQKSEGCTTTTASSCAVSCTTPSGQSTESCTTTKCETTSGCSVTNTVSITTKSGSCSPTNWADLQGGDEDSSGSDGGEEGPDPSYGGPVPAWVTAWPSEPTSAPPEPTTAPPEPTPAPPEPTPAPPEPTPPSVEPPGPQEECDECTDDMGASKCGPDDNDCLVNDCLANEHCKACGIDCSTFVSGSPTRRGDVLFVRAIVSARLKQMSKKLSRRKVIEPTSLARIASLDRPRSLYKRVEHNPAWRKFAPKGLRYYKMLQEKPMEDAAEPKMCELDDYFKVTKNKPTTAHLKNPLFEKIGVTPTISYYPLTVLGPKEGKSKNGELVDVADFSDTISAEQGIFFANANDRGEKKDGNGLVTQKGTPYQMSTIAWWMWKHTVMQGQDPKIKEEDTDFSNFKYFFRVNIDNADTQEILIDALGDSTEPKEFTPEDEGPDNAFWPLLGSPNGNTIAWFLADHKKSLKGKGIEKITAWMDGNDYFFWATIK